MKHVNQTNHESYERMNVMNKMKTRIGVVSMATLAMSGSVAGSAIAAISKSFPDTPISTIQLLSTLPGVGSLIITLVAGQMAVFRRRVWSCWGSHLSHWEDLFRHSGTARLPDF